MISIKQIQNDKNSFVQSQLCLEKQLHYTMSLKSMYWQCKIMLHYCLLLGGDANQQVYWVAQVI